MDVAVSWPKWSVFRRFRSCTGKHAQTSSDSKPQVNIAWSVIRYITPLCDKLVNQKGIKYARYKQQQQRHVRCSAVLHCCHIFNSSQAHNYSILLLLYRSAWRLTQMKYQRLSSSRWSSDQLTAMATKRRSRLCKVNLNGKRFRCGWKETVFQKLIGPYHTLDETQPRLGIPATPFPPFLELAKVWSRFLSQSSCLTSSTLWPAVFASGQTVKPGRAGF